MMYARDLTKTDQSDLILSFMLCHFEYLFIIL